MADAPTHKSEQTGSHALDRIQNNVRELMQFVKQLLVRIVVAENTFGRGIVRLAMPNADMTLVGDPRLAAGQIVLIGTLSADRTISLPPATDATAYFRWFANLTTGGFNVVLKAPGGTLTVANGAREGVWTSASGPGEAV